MFKDFSDSELDARKQILNNDIEALRLHIMLQLDALEKLCQEGVLIQEEIESRSNGRNSEQN